MNLEDVLNKSTMGDDASLTKWIHHMVTARGRLESLGVAITDDRFR